MPSGTRCSLQGALPALRGWRLLFGYFTVAVVLSEKVQCFMHLSHINNSPPLHPKVESVKCRVDDAMLNMQAKGFAVMNTRSDFRRGSMTK